MPRSVKSAKSDRKKKSASTDRGATGNKETKVVTWLPPPPALGERLLKALEHKPLEEKEIYGYKVSRRALKNLSQSEIKDLCDVFQIFDRDQTGFLKAKELYYAVKSLGFSISQRQCQDYIDSEVQINGETNGVSFSQFLDLVIDKQMNSKDYFDEILTGFDLFDYDAAGQISLAKLRIANDETGLGLTDTELKQMIQEADQNGDGFVDEEEFISVMLKTNLY